MSTTGEGGLKDGKVRRTLHNPPGLYRAENVATGTVHECTDLVTLLQRISEDFTRVEKTTVVEWNIRGVKLDEDIDSVIRH